MKLTRKTVKAIAIAALFSLLTVPAFAGNGYGPGDGTGTGDGPQDGTGNGPGDCVTNLQVDLTSHIILASSDNGKGEASGDQSQDRDRDRSGTGDKDQSQDRDRDQAKDGSCLS